MSAPPHDGWPAEGSVWEHWSDLLLATQLAALRSGFTGVGKRWEIAQPQRLIIRCDVRATALREIRCQHWLVRATPVNPVDLAGAWVVDHLRTENLDVRHHSNHHGGIGTTKGFESPSAKRPKLSVGCIVKTWKAMHRLEGSLRSLARQEGRFVAPYPKPTAYETANEPSYSYYFRCVLGDRCNFYISFVPHQQEDGVGWRCDKLCLKHSCTTTASKPSAALQQVLDFWPRLKVVGTYDSATSRAIQANRKMSLSKTDQHLGHYPVLAPGQTSLPQVLPLPPPQPAVEELPNDTSSAAKAQTASSNKCQRTVELLKLLEEKDTAEKKSKSNASSKQPLPPAPLDSTTPTSSNSPANTAQTDKLVNRQGSLVKAIDSLFSIRRFILDFEHKVSIASALDDLEGAGKYEAEMVELKQRRDDLESKVKKRKRKLERQKEKMKAKQMLEKKVVGNTSNSPKAKQGRKVKKSKKEKKR